MRRSKLSDSLNFSISGSMSSLNRPPHSFFVSPAGDAPADIATTPAARRARRRCGAAAGVRASTFPMGWDWADPRAVTAAAGGAGERRVGRAAATLVATRHADIAIWRGAGGVKCDPDETITNDGAAMMMRWRVPPARGARPARGRRPDRRPAAEESICGEGKKRAPHVTRAFLVSNSPRTSIARTILDAK